MLAISPQKRSGLWVITVGPGRDAVDHQRAEHQRHRPARGNPQGEHRDELALRVGVVGGLGSRHPLDRAVAETRRVLGKLLLEHVGRERGDRRPGAGEDAEERPEDGAPDDRADGLLYLRGREEASHLGGEDLLAPPLSPRLDDDFAHGEHPDGNHHETDPVRQLEDVEAEALPAGIDVGAHGTEEQAQHAPWRAT